MPALADDSLAYIEYIDDIWQAVVIIDGESTQVSRSEYDKTSMSWLAGGNKLFVSGMTGEAELHDLATGAVKNIRLPDRNTGDAVMSYDGKYILYSSVDLENTDNKLWLFDVATTTKIPLHAAMKGRQYEPKWDSGSYRYYFVSGVANTQYDIYTARVGDATARQHITNGRYNLDIDHHDTVSVWSTDASGNYDVWLESEDGRRRLTSFTGVDARPTISAAHDNVYFESMRDGAMQIWRMPLNTEDGEPGKAVQVTRTEQGARYPLVAR